MSKLRNNGMRLVCAVLIGTLWLIPTLTVCAGDINAEEQRLIDAADRNYTYDGKTYAPSEASRQRAIDYLKEDGVDLTADQVSKIIGMLDDNVERGIASGYLVEVPGQSSASGKESDKTEEEASSEAPTQSVESASAAESTAAQEKTTTQKETAVQETLQASAAESAESKAAEEKQPAEASESIEVYQESVEETVVEAVTEEDQSERESDVSEPKGISDKLGMTILIVSAVIVFFGVLTAVLRQNRGILK